MPSLGFSDAVAVTNTTVSPYRSNTAPFASSATLPISAVIHNNLLYINDISHYRPSALST